MIPKKTTGDQEGVKPALNEDQEKAVNHGAGPLLVSAGAGSGKTRTLTERLISLVDSGVPGKKIIAITFTNKAAQELKNRILKKLHLREYKLPFLGTFHSFGARILREEAAAFGRSGAYSIFDSDDSLRTLKNTIKFLGLPADKYPAAKISKDISEIKDHLLGKDSLKIELRRIFEEYESGLEKQNAFDFDDLIQKPVLLFSKNRDVLQKHQNRYSYILVDEFQDVNASQYALIKLLAEKHKNLNVVGDDNQSIFRFRGADFRIFLAFEKDWPGAAIINLGQNYRSTGNIVAASAAVIENNKQKREKKLWTDNPSGEAVRIIASYSAEDEAKTIADEIWRKREKKEIAVLYRTNAQSRALEQTFNLLSIPYEIFGGLKFYERKEIKDIVAGLRYAVNPKDGVSLERLHKSLRRAQFQALRDNLPALAATGTPEALINFFLKAAEYQNLLKNKFDNYEDRAENIAELLRFAAAFKTPVEFIEKISLLEATDRASGRNNFRKERVVKMMTMHLSKGLEFDEVYLAGVNEGLMPHERSLYSPEEVEEERRLMYVAMTRAREKLNISFYDIPSRFIYEIPENLLATGEELPVIDEDGIVVRRGGGRGR
ncbi:MAG: UvrD-helicase domain-containing protein [Patescibacteria group bacterium]|nr:UvrD-helicase domain-containing protein [Patescibacteria group bacterium]